MTDKKKGRKSKEEIAKLFDLPERKSKIASIMKQDGQAYCVCRSSDCSRFMIGCDGCEEWYHGDCINITEKESKHIKHYYCQKCKHEDPSLQTVFRVLAADKAGLASASSSSTGPGSGTITGSDGVKKKTKEKSIATKSLPARCGTCEECVSPDCGYCENCLDRSGTKECSEKDDCINQNKKGRKDKKDKIPKERKRKRSLTPEKYTNPELEGLRQCLGPRCRSQARSQSKYCSDKCGMNLATSRIFQVLPQRIQEWNLSGCRAEEENKIQLDSIRGKQAIVRRALTELDNRRKEIDLVVDRAKRSTIDPNAMDQNELEDEQSMYCITCGHEIHSRTAIRHMEKCFNKYESQASFGSIFKTRIDGNSMFCDFYNTASQTYCKRLRILCPEHCKDPKVMDADVCGCPLINNRCSLTGEFCRAPKKSCLKHFVWEKIRRAEIDLERVRQWLKMDELLEQERQIRASMTSRAGVLGLMLHSTYNHEVMEELCRKQQVQQQQQIQQQKSKNSTNIANNQMLIPLPQKNNTAINQISIPMPPKINQNTQNVKILAHAQNYLNNLKTLNKKTSKL